MARSRKSLIASSLVLLVPLIGGVGVDAAQAYPQRPSQYSDKTVTVTSTDKGAVVTAAITWYSCDSTYKCSAYVDVTVKDVAPDGRGAIVHAQFLDRKINGNPADPQQQEIYLHETRGNGYSKSAQQYHDDAGYVIGNRTDSLWIRACNGGSQSNSNNCKTLYVDDPYS